MNDQFKFPSKLNLKEEVPLHINDSLSHSQNEGKCKPPIGTLIYRKKRNTTDVWKSRWSFAKLEKPNFKTYNYINFINFAKDGYWRLTSWILLWSLHSRNLLKLLFWPKTNQARWLLKHGFSPWWENKAFVNDFYQMYNVSLVQSTVDFFQLEITSNLAYLWPSQCGSWTMGYCSLKTPILYRDKTQDVH